MLQFRLELLILHQSIDLGRRKNQLDDLRKSFVFSLYLRAGLNNPT